jgi:hypothetical protein
MKSVTNYEDLTFVGHTWQPELLEAYSGAAVVQWYGNIERQLKHLADEYESARNHNYVDKIREFLKTWRDTPIDGSLNRESLDVLSATVKQLAVDGWKLSDYFASIRNQLQRLIASQEELPNVEPSPEGAAGSAGPSAGRKEPPTSEFGPQEKEGEPPTEGEEAPEGAKGQGGQAPAQTSEIDQALDKLKGMKP